MNDSYIKLLNDTFGDLTKVTSKKLRSFLSEIMREVFTLRVQLESPNPEEREAAQKHGEALKALLENQMKSACEALGLTPSEAFAVAEVITGYKERTEEQRKPANERPRKNKKLINLVG